MKHRAKPTQDNSWWLRNRRWMAAVVPALALMLGASSYRYTNVYLPNEWSSSINLDQGEWGKIDTHQVVDGLDIEVRAEMQVEGVQNLGRDTIPEIVVPEGTNLWMVATQWKADPEAPLTMCQMTLFDQAGKEYTYLPSLMKIEDFELSSRLNQWVECVPSKNPGPEFPSHFHLPGEVQEPSTRPEEWEKGTLFVLPAGVTPTQLQVGWYEPYHFKVKLGEPRTDLFDSQSS